MLLYPWLSRIMHDRLGIWVSGRSELLMQDRLSIWLFWAYQAFPAFPGVPGVPNIDSVHSIHSAAFSSSLQGWLWPGYNYRSISQERHQHLWYYKCCRIPGLVDSCMIVWVSEYLAVLSFSSVPSVPSIPGVRSQPSQRSQRSQHSQRSQRHCRVDCDLGIITDPSHRNATNIFGTTVDVANVPLLS